MVSSETLTYWMQRVWHPLLNWWNECWGVPAPRSSWGVFPGQGVRQYDLGEMCIFGACLGKSRGHRCSPEPHCRDGRWCPVAGACCPNFHLLFSGTSSGWHLWWLPRKLGAKSRGLLERPEAPSAIKGKAPQPSWACISTTNFFLHLRAATWAPGALMEARSDSFTSPLALARWLTARTQSSAIDVLLSRRNFSRIAPPWRSARYVSVTIHHLCISLSFLFQHSCLRELFYYLALIFFPFSHLGFLVQTKSSCHRAGAFTV